MKCVEKEATSDRPSTARFRLERSPQRGGLALAPARVRRLNMGAFTMGGEGALPPMIRITFENPAGAFRRRDRRSA
jgi:hypothetical protein